MTAFFCHRQPCLPPKASPGPPATHFDIAKRELDVINEEICRFYPFVSPSCHAIKGNDYVPDDEVTLQLISAAEKLREFAEEKPEVKGSQLIFSSIN